MTKEKEEKLWALKCRYELLRILRLAVQLVLILVYY
jgi:hypothetical protein